MNKMIVAGCDVGSTKTKRAMQKEAIDNNVAEWRIDPKTGEKEFVYLTPKKEEK